MVLVLVLVGWRVVVTVESVGWGRVGGGGGGGGGLDGRRLQTLCGV